MKETITVAEYEGQDGRGFHVFRFEDYEIRVLNPLLSKGYKTGKKYKITIEDA